MTEPIETADNVSGQLNQSIEAQAALMEIDVPKPELIRTDTGEEIFDFTGKPKSLKFKIGDDYFEPIPELPGLAGMEFMAYMAQMESIGVEDAEKQADLVERMFRMLLKKDSADVFIERLKSTEKPIGVAKMNGVMQWLMGEYGLRPTEPSEPSPDGS